MAKKTSGARRRSKYGSPYQPQPSGSSHGLKPSRGKDWSPRRKKKIPTLWIVGACAVLGVVAVRSCGDDADDDPGVVVRRAVYASQEDCIADWNTPSECEDVPLEVPAPRSVGLVDVNSAASGAQAASLPPAEPAQETRYTYHHRWYGPYYSTNGTVYHADGTTTRQAVAPGTPRPLMSYDSNGALNSLGRSTDAPTRSLLVEEATLRRSALGGGRSMGISMRSAAISRAPVVSRGGFTSHSGSGRSSGGGRSGGG